MIVEQQCPPLPNSCLYLQISHEQRRHKQCLATAEQCIASLKLCYAPLNNQ